VSALTVVPDQVVEPDVSQVGLDVLRVHFEKLIVSNCGNGCTLLGRKNSESHQRFLKKDTHARNLSSIYTTMLRNLVIVFTVLLNKYAVSSDLHALELDGSTKERLK
jgi:hypothetical protein